MSYTAAVQADSPIIWWRLDEAGGNFADSSGGGWTATPTGSFTYQVPSYGQIGGTAVTLSGDDYAQASSAFDFANADSFTIEAWIKTTMSSNSGGIFEGGANAPSLRVDGATGFVTLLRSHSAVIASSTVAVNDGQWYHVVATKNGADVHLYKNAVDVTGTVTDATISNNNNLNGFGAQWLASTPDANSQFIGNLDEIAIYNGALSQARIQAHFAAAQSGSDLQVPHYGMGMGLW